MQGVYEIVNKNNGKRYIGSSVDIDLRFKGHLRDLRKGKHVNIKLQRAYDKHGEDCFIQNMIEECLERENLLDREQWYLDNTECQYNLSPNARGGNLGEEAIRKMRISMKGKNTGPRSEETKRKLSIAATGFRHSDETRMKMSESHTGTKRPHHSAQMAGSGNPMFGKKNPGASKWWKEYWDRKKAQD
jgi:group I intron endonuclease